jgi:cold shock CspA family protein
MFEARGRTRPFHGRVKAIFRDDGYGFLESQDGRDIYFHENSVLNGDFDKLDTGSEVTYAEEMGAKGPQASSLRLVGRNGFHAFPRHN